MIWMRTQAWLGLGEACPGVSRSGPSPPWERRRPRRQGSEGWRWFPPMKVARMPEDQTASPHPDPVRTGSRRRHQTRLPVVPDPEREGRDAVPAWRARLMWNRNPAVVSGRWGWEDSPQARDGYWGCHRACAQACSSTMRKSRCATSSCRSPHPPTTVSGRDLQYRQGCRDAGTGSRSRRGDARQRCCATPSVRGSHWSAGSSTGGWWRPRTWCT
jgi:hypothetical protein